MLADVIFMRIKRQPILWKAYKYFSIVYWFVITCVLIHFMGEIGGYLLGYLGSLLN